jgi:hypothetical protein
MLHLEGRNPAKFRFSDGLSETVVVLQPDDDSETLAAKLQRVLELEGIAPPAAPPALIYPPGARNVRGGQGRV